MTKDTRIIPREEYLLGLPKKRMAAGVIIRDKNGKILILKTSYKDSWEIPGGVTEKGESLKQCAKREVMEEIGVNITVGDLLCLEYLQTDIDDCLMFVFDGGINNLANIKLDNKEIIDALYVSEQNLEKYITHKGLLERVKSAIDPMKSGTHYFENI